MKSYTLNYSSYINENLNKQERQTIAISCLKQYLDILKQRPEYARPIFRGTSFHNSGTPVYAFDYDNNDVYISYIKPLESRNSLTSTNKGYDTFWNLWLSNSSDWKNFPSRKYNANICTTNPAYANHYGACNIVIPVNLTNTKFGICSKGDLFDSFKTINKFNLTPKSFSIFFIQLLDNIQKQKNKKVFDIPKLIENYEQIFEILNYIDRYFKELVNDENFDVYETVFNFDNLYLKLFEHIYNFYKEKTNTIFNFFQETFEPNYNDFKIAKDIINLLDKIKKDSLDNNEVWFNGDYIGINLLNTQLLYNFIKYPDSYITFIEQTILNLQNVEK